MRIEAEVEGELDVVRMLYEFVCFGCCCGEGESGK